jgi:hypothetical protein
MVRDFKRAERRAWFVSLLHNAKVAAIQWGESTVELWRVADSEEHQQHQEMEAEILS